MASLVMSLRRAMSTGSSSRAKAWEAQRATWRLANRGDTHYAAERRLYRMQLSELRKEWLLEDLHARRAAYVAQRDAIAQRAAKPSRKSRDDDEALAAERAARAERVRREQERAAKQQANARKVGEMRASRRDAAEREFRLRWMREFLRTQDVDGHTSLSRTAARPWLTPENLDSRLGASTFSVRKDNPVAKWEGIARDEQNEANREAHGGWLAGGLLAQGFYPVDDATKVLQHSATSHSRSCALAPTRSRARARAPSSLHCPHARPP